MSRRRKRSRASARGDAELLLHRLGQVAFLRALPPEEVQALVPHVEQLRYRAGDRLMAQGESGDALYLIESGEARVTRGESAEAIHVGAGSVVGEAALLTGEPRSATVEAATELLVWRLGKGNFDAVVAASPVLKQALLALVESRRAGTAAPLPSEAFWVSTALRAAEARYRGLTGWERAMGVGIALWLLLAANADFVAMVAERSPFVIALVQLRVGLLLIQGACEAFLHGVERLGARKRWNGFISGTVGSVLSTLPEFVVVAFLVRVNPLAAFVTATVTIYNNALAFSIYSFFLPKDRQGVFAMPRSLSVAGGELLISAAALTLVLGSIMLTIQLNGPVKALVGIDLMVIGIVLIAIYGYYLLTLVRYYGEGADNLESVPVDPSRLGHDTRWRAIAVMFLLGIAGSYGGGESIGAFAETMLNRLQLPTIPTAALLAFFAGVSEYVIVYKSHRRGELGIALSNVFGGLTQVLFLLLPFALIATGVAGVWSGNTLYAVPVNSVTVLLVLLLFPLFYALHQFIEQEKSLSNLDAAGMTGVYLLVLYFLLTAPA